ncbi:ORF64 [Betabaculovirus altermyunipunctae]|uniref:ORF64 n=1 Tax=Betabaculovirus altermyunipunctae TaxID=3051996 RepID=A0A1S5YDY5_9BBAC|nr:ORF64 [Betabaculovirus altermyunipunctae]AQQ80331.1 ORF64 [Betabaculovirus altermyunipunctae]
MLLLIFVLIIVGVIILTFVLYQSNNEEPVKVPDVVAEGPTCDTYYLNDTLVACPDKHEFRETKCVPIDETGCTAALHPTKITASEMVCGNNKRFVRVSGQPCQLIRNCVTLFTTTSREGYCFELQSDGEYAEVECMQVPGCRHLDAIHIPKDISFDNALPFDEVPCPLASHEPIENYRNADQPCFSGYMCVNRNEVIEIVCINSCFNNQMRCADCALYDRCLYRSAYTPVTAIANS